jgi:flagellin
LAAGDITTPVKNPAAIHGITFTNTNVATVGVGPTSTVAYTAGTAFVAAAAAGQSAYTSALNFQVGDTDAAVHQVAVDLRNSYTTTDLGLGASDLLTAANAAAYITTTIAALDLLTIQRADLGATQNQLSFVNANLATSIEQVTAAVSSIRDADMAAEMTNFTKSQILVQAGTSMLAQANQASQNVLSLFR